MKNKLYFLSVFVCYLFLLLPASAQSWQWGKRGGNKGGTSSDEQVRSIATDKNGNSYILAQVFSDKLMWNIDVDGNDLGKGNNEEDICLISFDCEGKYRWSKIIGGRYADRACDVQVDTLGGVYIVGNIYAINGGDSIAVSTDTMIYAPVLKGFFKSFFILKYDTSGNYQWLRMPEPDTMSVSKYSGAIAMGIDKSGNTSILTYINHTGAFANGAYVIPPTAVLPAMHMLKYDRNGNFIKGFPMAISEGDVSSLFYMRMAWDAQNDVYYILSLFTGTGFVAPKFGTTTMTGTNCLAKFTNTGASLWVKQSSSSYNVATNRTPKLDNEGNIYIASSERVGENFGTFTATNTLSGVAAVPVIIKIRASDGSVMWGHSVGSDYAAGGTAVEVAPDGTVGFATVSHRTISIGPYRSYSSGGAMNVAFIRFDQHTGAIKSFDTMNASSAAIVEIMASDRNSNFYLGGYMDAHLRIVGMDTLIKYGGRNDFFVVKYGETNCSESVSVKERTYADIKIYPNPAQDLLTIEGLSSGSEVQVLNMLGQVVVTHTARSVSDQIGVNQLSPGFYILQIRGLDGQSYTVKFIKE